MGSVPTRAVLCLAAALAAAPAPARVDLPDLTVAAIRGEARRVEALLRWGADPDGAGWLGLTPLAATMRRCAAAPEVVYILLRAGADIETRSGIGATPLMLAHQTGRADLVELLLAFGADPEARNMYGDSVEDYARFFAGTPPEGGLRAARFTSLRRGVPADGAGMPCAG